MNKKIVLLALITIVAMLILTTEKALAACALCGIPIRQYPVQFNRPFPVQFGRPAPVQFNRFNLQSGCNRIVINRPSYTTSTTFRLPSFFGCQGVCNRFVVN